MKKYWLIVLGIMLLSDVFSQSPLVVSNNDFTFKIYKATKPDSTNFFISPFSLNFALAIGNEGASGSTRNELDRLLCINTMENRAEEYAGLYEEQPGLFLANSVWLSKDIRIDNSYKRTIEAKYHSTVFTYDKNNIPAASLEMNRWVANATHQNITKMPELSPLTKLSIMNAVYFIGEWNNPFNKALTAQRFFYDIDRVSRNVDFMNSQAYFSYYEDADVQGVSLPYLSDRFSMMVLLPKDRYGISTLEEKMCADYLKQVQKGQSSKEVILSLPKFKIETELSPKMELMKMGYVTMFSDKADFSGISRTDSLKIDRITHKTFIEIDEVKTEAAAVTKVEMIRIGSVSSYMEHQEPVLFTANHPFVFFIIDNKTNAILFLGKFVKS